MNNEQTDINFHNNPNPENIVLEEVARHHHDNSNYKINSKGKRRKINPFKRSKHKSGHSHKKGKLVKRILLGILIFIILALLIGFIAYKISNAKGKKELLTNTENVTINSIADATANDSGQTVIYKGNTYKFNKDLATIVIMGVDKSELSSDVPGDAGQADAVYIFTYDTKTGKCSMIPVSRDTMTEAKLLSVSGKEMGLEKMQLCLSYAYGDGKATSCENTLESLSRIFYNIPFKTYVALNWDSIAPLNDAIGGIDVTSIEDIHNDYLNISKGDKKTLMGKEAWSYVKYRDTTKLKSNAYRIARQKQYIKAFAEKLIPMAQNDITIVSKLYTTASDYMYTNLTQNKVVYIASEMLPNVYSTKDINFYEIEGTIKMGEKYAEFYPDETSLYETILKVFYIKQQ